MIISILARLGALLARAQVATQTLLGWLQVKGMGL
jgi:uncharacterized membrane protein